MVKIVFLKFLTSKYWLYFGYTNTLITLDTLIFIIRKYKLINGINNYKQFTFIIIYIKHF